tara:strand:+ start:1683 stop:2444 length:762 start_codon:yes stop_codon:yes gene_type:complete
MIRQLFSSAILAGLMAGLLISAVYQFTTVPLILHAESFENIKGQKKAIFRNPEKILYPADNYIIVKASIVPVHGSEEQSPGEAWAPQDGLERIFYTTVTTILTGIGFALLLISGMIMRGDKIDTRRGLLWGAGGFIAFVLAPSLGLPPELPGMVASDVLARQSWWITTAVASIVGLWLLVFSKKMLYKILAVVIALTPHLVGAPHPEALSSNGVPPELAAQFVTVSIAVGGLFWALIGGFSGYFYERLERTNN